MYDEVSTLFKFTLKTHTMTSFLVKESLKDLGLKFGNLFTS